MKYRVFDESTNSFVEFSTQEEAIQFCIANNINQETVETIVDDPEPYRSPYEIFRIKVDAGFPVPNTPYSLAIDDQDRAVFSQMLVLTNELLEMGAITLDTVQTIRDKDGNVFDVSTEQFKQLIVGLGLYYKQIWDEKVEAEAQGL